MAATVTFCDQRDCVFWREPNDCKSVEIEIEGRKCVTYASDDDVAAQERWLEDKVLGFNMPSPPGANDAS